MANEQSCFVYIQLPGTHEWLTCARLTIEELGAGEFVGTLVYGRNYRGHKDAIPLDEFVVPLDTSAQTFTKLKGVPGPIRDASPDHWGRRVIQAKLGRSEADLSEMDYLLNGPDDGAGNLRFGIASMPTTPIRKYNRTHQLADLLKAAETLEEHGKLPHEVLEELEPGTSMGGARPKVTIEDDKKIWLAKLPEKKDVLNMQRIEYATLELARATGLNVCRTRLEPLARKNVLMLDRFDREWDPEAKKYLRFGLVSGLTVLDAEDGYQGRDRWSYPLLAQEIRRRSVKPEEDCRELFRRMVFNAMVTNNDDHPRNHAMLCTRDGWRLSPAYDIVPKDLVSQERRDLALEVGQYGRAASIYNLLSSCGDFGLNVTQAQAEIDQMRAVLQGWEEFYARRGVDEAGIAMLRKAILPQSFELTERPAAI